MRILIVDDNEDLAETQAALLELLGHEVRIAFDGPAALQIAPDLAPQVVLVDIGLPGMDGLEVARKLRQMPKLQDVVLLAQTGWGEAKDRDRTREAGFDHHLVKPVAPATVERLLGQIEQKLAASKP